MRVEQLDGHEARCPMRERSLVVGASALVVIAFVVVAFLLPAPAPPVLPSQRLLGQESQPPALVTFHPDISFATALRTITDLGLQPSGLPCPSSVMPDGTAWTRWTPLLDATQFAEQPVLTVQPTPLTPGNWLRRLQAAPQVLTVRTNLIVNCGPIIAGSDTPPLGTLVTLGLDVPVHYMLLTFAPGVGYDAALQAISDLGLRLANPAAECAVAAGTPSPWQPVGQEASFAGAHTLLVAPGPAASTLWPAQAAAATGVDAAGVSYVAACG
jgi:hypothetical protein